MTKKFDDIDKNEPFKAPEGYFDRLEDRIMERIESEEEQGTESRGRIIAWQPMMKYAAAAAIALLAVFILIRSPWSKGSESAEDLLAEVPAEAIVDYLAYTEISSAEILENSTFTMADADSISVTDPILPDVGEIDDIDLLIEEYSPINLDSNAL